MARNRGTVGAIASTSSSPGSTPTLTPTHTPGHSRSASASRPSPLARHDQEHSHHGDHAPDHLAHAAAVAHHVDPSADDGDELGGGDGGGDGNGSDADGNGTRSPMDCETAEAEADSPCASRSAFLADLESSDPSAAVSCASRAAVYPILHLVRHDVALTIDTALSWSELTSHELNFALVRPLALKYAKLRSPAILYVCLTARIHFLREAEKDLAYQGVNATRAMLCELLAIKLLRTFAGGHGHSHAHRHAHADAQGMDLVTALCAPFSPFRGAPQSALDSARRRGFVADNHADPAPGTASPAAAAAAAAAGDPHATSTLQLAIRSSAKKFVATPLVQKCVDGIWNGQIVLGNASTTGRGIIDDSYKKRPVSFYDPATAPFLDYHRLRVPRIRSFLEALNFAFILLFYISALSSKGSPHFTPPEVLFSIWLLGLAIDEAAQVKEHGLVIYLGSLFNVLDCLFCAVGGAYFGIRMAGLVGHNQAQSNLSFDVLALGAILLCPRLASFLVSDNVLLLALRAMVVEFSYFLGLALVFFSGFSWTFWALSDSERWTPGTIIWLLYRFTFGNTIELSQAKDFSPYFGPTLVVTFTILAQTLLLTILITLLSATFSRVAAHAQEESLFQHSYATLQGASAEALFSYYPPLNIICLFTVLPASFLLTPRWVHKINVFVIRTTHLPVLLAIRWAQQLSHSWNEKGISLGADGGGSEGAAAAAKRHWWGWGGGGGQPDIIEAAFEDVHARARSDTRTRQSEAALSGFSSWPKHGGGQLRPALASHIDPKTTVGESPPTAQAQQSTAEAERSRERKHKDPSRSRDSRDSHLSRASHASHASGQTTSNATATTGDYPDSPGARVRRARAAWSSAANAKTGGGSGSSGAAGRHPTFREPQPKSPSILSKDLPQLPLPPVPPRGSSTVRRAGRERFPLSPSATAPALPAHAHSHAQPHLHPHVLPHVHLPDPLPSRPTSISTSGGTTTTTHTGNPLARMFAARNKRRLSTSSIEGVFTFKRRHSLLGGGGGGSLGARKAHSEDVVPRLHSLTRRRSFEGDASASLARPHLERESRRFGHAKHRSLDVGAGAGPTPSARESLAGALRNAAPHPYPHFPSYSHAHSRGHGHGGILSPPPLPVPTPSALRFPSSSASSPRDDAAEAMLDRTPGAYVGAGAAPGTAGVRDLMLSFLERLDEQASAVQRIESVLLSVVAAGSPANAARNSGSAAPPPPPKPRDEPAHAHSDQSQAAPAVPEAEVASAPTQLLAEAEGGEEGADVRSTAEVPAPAEASAEAGAEAQAQAQTEEGSDAPPSLPSKGEGSVDPPQEGSGEAASASSAPPSA